MANSVDPDQNAELAADAPPHPVDRPQLPAGADRNAGNADSVTPVAPPASAIPTTRNVFVAGWVTGLTAAIVCTIMRAIATLFGTDFLVEQPFAEGGLVSVPWAATFVMPLIAGIGGAAVAAVFLGIKGCQRWVFWLGTLALAVSLTSPLLQPEGVTWPTKVWLSLMHVVTWFLVVPQVARVVGDSDPRVTAGYRDV
jgi:hypothetical protein